MVHLLRLLAIVGKLLLCAAAIWQVFAMVVTRLAQRIAIHVLMHLRVRWHYHFIAGTSQRLIIVKVGPFHLIVVYGTAVHHLLL